MFTEAYLSALPITEPTTSEHWMECASS